MSYDVFNGYFNLSSFKFYFTDVKEAWWSTDSPSDLRLITLTHDTFGNLVKKKSKYCRF